MLGGNEGFKEAWMFLIPWGGDLLEASSAPLVAHSLTHWEPGESRYLDVGMVFIGGDVIFLIREGEDCSSRLGEGVGDWKLDPVEIKEGEILECFSFFFAFGVGSVIDSCSSSLDLAESSVAALVEGESLFLMCSLQRHQTRTTCRNSWQLWPLGRLFSFEIHFSNIERWSWYIPLLQFSCHGSTMFHNSCLR